MVACSKHKVTYFVATASFTFFSFFFFFCKRSSGVVRGTMSVNGLLKIYNRKDALSALPTTVHLGTLDFLRILRPLCTINFTLFQFDQVEYRIANNLQCFKIFENPTRTTARTFPNIVCLRLRSFAGPSVMKNCEPLSCGPAFAMPTRPRRLKRKRS